jgi:hypothetical protein
MPQHNKDRSPICADFLETASKYDSNSYSIIAGDETCCPQYDSQTKIQSAEWRRTNAPASRKFRAEPSKTKQNKKNYSSFIFNCRFVVHKELLSQSQTVNQDVYKGVLQRLLEGIRRRRPALWATGKWFLLHNNARPHTTLSIKES